MYQKLSCCDFAFPLLRHEDALYLISRMGFAGVDIGLFENRSHLQPSDQFCDIRGAALQLKGRLEQYQLLPADVFMQAERDLSAYPSNHYESRRRLHARDLFLKTLEYANYLQCPHVSLLPGVCFAEEPYEKSYERCVEEHLWRVAQAEKAGIKIGIEAHVGSIVPTTKQAAQLMKDVPGLTLTLDYSHFVRQGEPDVNGDALLPYASHFHARGASNGHLQTCLADSEIDFERIMKQMMEISYNGWICIEYAWTPYWEDCCRNDNLSETILTKEQIEKFT